MKTKIIAIAQIKGGCGKTLVAAHIAGILSEKNTVTIIDGDKPQFTLTNWFNAGEEKNNIELAQAEDGQGILKAVDHFDGKVDYIVIDLAPRLADLTRAGIAVSDITIIPVNTDLAEVWALNLTLDLMTEAKEKIKGFKSFVLMNKYQSYNENHIAIREDIKEQFKCKILDNHIGLRKSFSSGIGFGQTVLDVRPKDKKAISEMVAVVNEIKVKLGVKS